MKRILVLGLAVFTLAVLTLAGCGAATPSGPPTLAPPASSAIAPTAEPLPADTSQSNLYNPPEAPAFAIPLPATSDEAYGLAAMVANAFGEIYEWPDAGPYPEVLGFYGFGTSTAESDADRLTIVATTTLVADPKVDNAQASKICAAIGGLWETVGSPPGWNATFVTSEDGQMMAFCTGFATGP
jgi:hypothetical protein